MVDIDFTFDAAHKVMDFIQEVVVDDLVFFLLSMQTPYQQLAYRFFCNHYPEIDFKLRVFITGGGCHGFQYDFDLVNVSYPDDVLVTKNINQNDVSLVVDSVSQEYLKGAVIDYQKDANGECFIIRNLQAKSTCSCGSSFSLE